MSVLLINTGTQAVHIIQNVIQLNHGIYGEGEVWSKVINLTQVTHLIGRIGKN